MGKKAQRIAELNGHVVELNRQLAAEIKRNHGLAAENERLKAERKPSLADAAKREWQQFTDRLMDGLGL